MKIRLIISILVAFLVVMSGLLAALLHSRSLEAAALHRVATVATSNFNGDVVAMRGKSDELLGAIRDRTTEPGMAERMTPFYDSARKIKLATDTFVAFVGGVARQLMAQGGGDAAVKTNTSYELQKRLIAAFQSIVASSGVDDGVKTRWNTLYAADLRDTAGWQELMFGRGVTRDVALLNLSRLTNEIVKVEYESLSHLFNSARPRCTLHFSRYTALAVPMSAYLFPGDRDETHIFMFDQEWMTQAGRQIKDIKVDGQKLSVVNSIGKYARDVYKPGIYRHSGFATVGGGDDESERRFNFQWETFVLDPAIHVGYDRPVILEAGKDEALAITSGILNAADLRVSLSRGHIEGKNGHYTVRVDEPGQVTLSVGRNQGGRTRVLDSFVYEVH